ncbi:MAG TPA: glycosyltransferase [Terriglobales bacterium]|nr:glycosyltransferase [Terriglobales bacterium]
MKICLVTAFPPSRRGLNEYGYHIARELQADPLLSVTVLGDETEGVSSEELPDFDVRRVWDFNHKTNPLRILSAVRDIKPDVVWYNLLFSTFGNEPVAAFFGLSSPALTRLSGVYTHVTLHHLMDNVDLNDAGVRSARLYRSAGKIATRMLLTANSVSVLLPAYRRTLIEKYRGENIHFRSHGILSARPEYPDFSMRGKPHTILAFGKWGTYKRLELLIEAFEQISRHRDDLRLVIAGSNHPQTPGYVESVAAQVAHNRNIRFTGYVVEEEIAPLFRSATVLVLPYSSATGSSGVAHLAAEYGVPIISADIEDFRDMSLDEGLAIEFYHTGIPESMAQKIIDVVDSPERQKEMAEANFSAALRMTMPQIIRRYLRSFDAHQRAKALAPISRFRRLPAWIPSRSAIFRAAAPRWSPWM